MFRDLRHSKFTGYLWLELKWSRSNAVRLFMLKQPNVNSHSYPEGNGLFLVIIFSSTVMMLTNPSLKPPILQQIYSTSGLLKGFFGGALSCSLFLHILISAWNSLTTSTTPTLQSPVVKTLSSSPFQVPFLQIICRSGYTSSSSHWRAKILQGLIHSLLTLLYSPIQSHSFSNHLDWLSSKSNFSPLMFFHSRSTFDCFLEITQMADLPASKNSSMSKVEHVLFHPQT